LFTGWITLATAAATTEVLLAALPGHVP